MPAESANIELARQWVGAFNADDPEASLALIHRDFVMSESTTLPGAATVAGADGLRRYRNGWKRQWSAAEWRPQEFMDLPPNHVVMVADLWLRGLRSGAEVERRWIYLFEICDGLLLRQDGFDALDEALAAARTGAAPGVS